jgi:hypothetical protein
MTATENLPDEAARPRTLQDDLLQDLRLTAPMPDPRPGAQRPRAKRPVIDADARARGVELRVTRNPWVSPSMRLAQQGLVLRAGPISVSVGLSGR